MLFGECRADTRGIAGAQEEADPSSVHEGTKVALQGLGRGVAPTRHVLRKILAHARNCRGRNALMRLDEGQLCLYLGCYLRRQSQRRIEQAGDHRHVGQRHSMSCGSQFLRREGGNEGFRELLAGRREYVCFDLVSNSCMNRL